PVMRTFQARFTIQDPGSAVALGMTATVHLTSADPGPAYVLPLSSLLRTPDDHPAVWVIGAADGRLTLAPVEVSEYRHDTVILSARWPGATSDQVQRELADRLEEKLQETPHLDYLRTYSMPEQALVTVQLRDDAPPSAVSDVWYQVRKKVGDIKHTLPEGTLG